MAGELGLDVAQCKRSAFLHDIGKALTHEVEGSHAIIGADLARKYGEHPDVVHAIEAHHNEVEVRTVEAVLTQAADAISGSRPGARRESIEAYVQRLESLEKIAAAREGVDKVFAMQAGREIRVMVAPDVVDDIEAQVLARDLAKQIEEELTYPGQIKVTWSASPAPPRPRAERLRGARRRLGCGPTSRRWRAGSRSSTHQAAPRRRAPVIEAIGAALRAPLANRGHDNQAQRNAEQIVTRGEAGDVGLHRR